MLVLRCTKRLSRRFELQLADKPAASTGSLGDWYANLLNLGKTRWILCVSERTLLPVIIPARTDAFRDHFPATLREVLSALRIKEGQIASELNEARDITFARTNNRRVLGVMNDFTRNIDVYPEPMNGLGTTTRAALWLAETPCRPIGYESPDHLVRTIMQSVNRPQ